MDCVIFCGHVDDTLQNAEQLPPVLAESYELVMLPLAGKPAINHVLAGLIAAGVERVYLVADHAPDALRQMLGSSRRWGLIIEVISSTGSMEDTLSALPSVSSPFLCMQAPAVIAETELVDFLAHASAPACLSLSQGSDLWLLASKNNIASQLDSVQFRQEAKGVSLRSLSAVHAANMMVLQGDIPLQGDVAASASVQGKAEQDAPNLNEKTSGTEIAQAGHHSRIAPTATLIPPYVIGDFVTVGNGVTIGPFASVGNNCIIDDNAEIRFSVLGERTYVGSMTYYDNMVAVGQVVINATDETCILIPDDFLQSDVEQAASQRGRAIMHRAIAFACCLLFSPLLLLQWLAGGGKFTKEDVAGVEACAELSCDPQPARLTVNATSFGGAVWGQLPRLVDVVFGRLMLIGPEIVTLEQARGFNSPWERLRFKVAPGVLPPWVGLSKGPLDTFEKKAMNAWYARHYSLGEDMKILRGALKYGGSHSFAHQ